MRSISILNNSLPEASIQYIISNDGSTRLEREQICVLTSTENVLFLDNSVNEGKGSAIRRGTVMAIGDIIIYTDIDFPFGTEPVVEMVKVFSENPKCLFVYGNRCADYFNKLPLKRKLFSKVLMMLNRVFLSNRITDTQAGIKGLRREVLPVIQGTKTNTFVFEIELMRKLVKRGIGIEKVEVFAKPSIVFTDFSIVVLFREAVNFARIITSTTI